MTRQRASHEWTEAEEQQLRALHAQGLSSSQIAVKIGRGKTRSGVIGKLHRLGIVRPQAAQSTRTRIYERKGPKPDAPPKAKIGKPSLPVIPPPRSTFQDDCIILRKPEPDRCSFPIGDPSAKGFHLCGLPRRKGSSYCEDHYTVAHAPNQTNTRLKRSTAERAVMGVIHR